MMVQFAAHMSPKNDPRWRTGDHHIISDGLRVWVDDLHPGTVTVDERRVPAVHWDGLFEVIADGGAVKRIDGARLWVMHPADGREPPPATSNPATSNPPPVKETR